VAELQEAIEKWGTTGINRPDTAFITRTAQEALVDESLIAELREMHSHEGVSMFNELIDLFLENAPRSITELVQNINDPPQVAMHAESLKSMAQNLGAKRMVHLTNRLEEMGRAGIVIGAPVVLRELETTFAQTREKFLELREK